MSLQVGVVLVMLHDWWYTDTVYPCSNVYTTETILHKSKKIYKANFNSSESNRIIVCASITLIIERANYRMNVSAGEFKPALPIVCPTNWPDRNKKS